jgi:transketolase
LDIIKFKEKCRDIRRIIIKSKHRSKSAHLGSAFSAVELLVYLYYDHLNLDLTKKKPDRDYFILSKAHSSILIYAILFDKGIISKKEIEEVDVDGSYLGDHINSQVEGVEYSLGSLGHGLSVASGIALSSKMNGFNNKTIVLLGDGECNEGMIWEAASFAPVQKLKNLIAIIDYNKLQGFGRTSDFSDMTQFSLRWKSFGWNVREIDGHNFDEIKSALNEIRENPDKPLVIIAHTVKGKGVGFIEDKLEWHYKSLNDEQLQRALDELK